MDIINKQAYSPHISSHTLIDHTSENCARREPKCVTCLRHPLRRSAEGRPFSTGTNSNLDTSTCCLLRFLSLPFFLSFPYSAPSLPHQHPLSQPTTTTHSYPLYSLYRRNTQHIHLTKHIQFTNVSKARRHHGLGRQVPSGSQGASLVPGQEGGLPRVQGPDLRGD